MKGQQVRDMKIEGFVMGSVGTNVYLLINEETLETVLVDPGDCPQRFLDHLQEKGLKIVGILLSHGHYDHILGIEKLRETCPVPVFAHEAEEALLNNPNNNLSAMTGRPCVVKDVTYVKDGQTLQMAGYNFQVLHTPGHTPGGCCYYIASEKILISGDTLFCASVGRTDFPGGSMSDLIRGIKDKLMVLPDEVRVLPGHMGESTIGYERGHNPYL